MTYWNETMQDDCCLIAADGWKAELTNINKGKKELILDSDLVPKTLVIDRYFMKEESNRRDGDKEGSYIQSAGGIDRRAWC